MHTSSHLCVQGPDSQHTSTHRLPTTPDNARLWRDGTQGGLMLVSSVQGQRLTRPPRLMCHRLSNINSKFSQNDNKAAIQKPRLSEKHKDPERHTSMVLFTCLTITSLCVQQLMRLPAKETHIDKPMFNRDYICPSCNWLPPSSTRVKSYSDSKTHILYVNTQH